MHSIDWTVSIPQVHALFILFIGNLHLYKKNPIFLQEEFNNQETPLHSNIFDFLVNSLHLNTDLYRLVVNFRGLLNYLLLNTRSHNDEGEAILTYERQSKGLSFIQWHFNTGLTGVDRNPITTFATAIQMLKGICQTNTTS